MSKGNNEWYTPRIYIESARSVMGRISVDPASNDKAQEWVKARNYYTLDNCGLTKRWVGKVWLNPPYSNPLIKHFIEKLITENPKEYITLVNASTDTSWCHRLFENADAVCFTKGRISFINDKGDTVKGNSRGQIFFYKGKNVDKFMEEFIQYGKVIKL